jgi:hypothetical protein
MEQSPLDRSPRGRGDRDAVLLPGRPVAMTAGTGTGRCASGRSDQTNPATDAPTEAVVTARHNAGSAMVAENAAGRAADGRSPRRKDH